ncbi:hypothetical protein BASA81_016019 [Batrachochytrium salamandrivorans]|nr:hypothetical protein BASA81_016019 [Batrachochytrium salamandrivorans]
MNINANAVYAYTHPEVPISTKNIGFLTSTELDELAADLWLLSPPCQPYSRKGSRRGIQDARADSFVQLLQALMSMKLPPVGSFNGTVVKAECARQVFRDRFFQGAADQTTLQQLVGYLDADDGTVSSEHMYVEEKESCGQAARHFDVVGPESIRSCCFTKAYGSYARGGGSVVRTDRSSGWAEREAAAFHEYNTLYEAYKKKGTQPSNADDDDVCCIIINKSTTTSNRSTTTNNRSTTTSNRSTTTYNYNNNNNNYNYNYNNYNYNYNTSKSRDRDGRDVDTRTGSSASARQEAQQDQEEAGDE